nr:glycosyltransferase [Anaerolineales bacterium]
MRLVYVLLSPTFGMHQYTADLANRMAQAGHDVHLVTTSRVPRDRYAPTVTIHTPVDTTNTGFSPEGLRVSAVRNTQYAIRNIDPDIVHFTGVHLWNVPLVWALRRRGIPVVHTLHDLDPHYGRRFSSLIRFWNRLIITSASHILVHGQRYRQQLIAQGLLPDRITHTPLLHLFLSYEAESAIRNPQSAIRHEPFALFFGRLEPYNMYCLESGIGAIRLQKVDS